ncbi:MAG: bifunctional oligoribonuclease/PAP phosphatase NrnA [Candidatus Doudnabacteria bacterium]|nr:bifunctional oligoribonuclease/PAP phosphatase NrnA [Candidatus Doudnabacteria bacterium]
MKNNNIAFKQAWQVISSSRKIFMTTHARTDGDDLGSLLALKLVLEKMGKELYCIIDGGVPHYLEFLPGSSQVKEEFENRDYDLVITFGCNNIERTEFNELKNIKAKKLNFDHHPDNKMFGDVNVVDENTAAVAELIYYFLKSNSEVVIDRDIATCLLTGIFTDTGGFKHSNTSSSVYQAAGELLKKGVRIDKIAKETYGNKRPQTLRAWARALENARYDVEKKMIFSVMTEGDMAELQAEGEDLAGFVEVLNHIPQAKFALMLRQDGDEVKGSLRSDPHKQTDVSQIAKFFGGGGHKYASGFKIKGKLIHGEKGWKIVQ